MVEMLQEFINKIPELIQEHWLKVLGTLAVTIFMSFWGLFSAWRRWRSRQDEGLLHLSLNTIEELLSGKDGAKQKWLMLDVLREDRLENSIEDPIVRWIIQRAAKKTTETQPFLMFSEKDRWYVMNTIRMLIAEQFAQGTAAKMSKTAKVDEINCVFAITYERYRGMRQGKLRVMIIREDILKDKNALIGEFQFQSPSHCDRVTTLLSMQANNKVCMDVRICIQL